MSSAELTPRLPSPRRPPLPWLPSEPGNGQCLVQVLWGGTVPHWRGHVGRPFPGSVCEGSQAAEFPTAALVLITANQWMPDSGQSKLLRFLPRPPQPVASLQGRNDQDGSPDPGDCTCISKCQRPTPACPACFTLPWCAACTPALHGSAAPCREGMGGELGGPQAVPVPHTHRRCCWRDCSLARHSQLLQAARLPQPRAVIHPPFPAGFAQTSLLSLCLF